MPSLSKRRVQYTVGKFTVTGSSLSDGTERRKQGILPRTCSKAESGAFYSLVFECCHLTASTTRVCVERCHRIATALPYCRTCEVGQAVFVATPNRVSYHRRRMGSFYRAGHDWPFLRKKQSPHPPHLCFAEGTSGVLRGFAAAGCGSTQRHSPPPAPPPRPLGACAL